MIVDSGCFLVRPSCDGNLEPMIYLFKGKSPQDFVLLVLESNEDVGVNWKSTSSCLASLECTVQCHESCCGYGRISSLWSHNDMIGDEIRVIAPPDLCQVKTTILILCCFVLSPLQIHSLFSRLKPINFDHIWSFGEIWISLITCNSMPFYPIDKGFSPDIIEFNAEK